MCVRCKYEAIHDLSHVSTELRELADNALRRLLYEKPCSFRAIQKRFSLVTEQGHGISSIFT